MKIAAVIPAYQPAAELPAFLDRLREAGFSDIVVVDDGSSPACAGVFEECARRPGVHLARHAINLGKGAALKTGFNHVLCWLQDCGGVVTADADGQHDAADVARVAEALRCEPAKLVLGVRHFEGDVPPRSRAGNAITRLAMRALLGRNISDTQTGLRGIPRAFLPPLLAIRSTGYDFELDMLIACKHRGWPVAEVPIRTIYLERNRSSHFNPLLDSMRIYFVLLRFGMLSLATALVDNLVFAAAFAWTGSVLRSQAIGRCAAVVFNYTAARRAVFLSRERHRATLPKYLLLVFASGAVSYALIRMLAASLNVPVIWAKVLAESALFLVNFLVQRDLVFTRRAGDEGARTDWDRYYRATPFTAKLTRKYTTAVLTRALREACGSGAVMVELGGANSCFLDRIAAELSPREYHVVDTNRYGLDLLGRRGRNVVLHEGDVLALPLRLQADAVFSVGLIEHFDPAGTRRAVKAHFDLLKPGGAAVLSFPTPTWLYRAARAVAEAAGLWRFPDERPLAREEVAAALPGNCEIVFEKTLWPLVYTQKLMVVRWCGA